MPIHQLTPQEAKRMHDAGEAFIIDLRGEEQFSACHIKGAEHIPADTIDVHQLPERSGKKLIVHCNRGGRAGRFCSAVIAADSDAELYHLQGGINAWIGAGLPTSSTT
jgi:hydroxyacylglutathione hydrolase